MLKIKKRNYCIINFYFHFIDYLYRNWIYLKIFYKRKLNLQSLNLNIIFKKTSIQNFNFSFSFFRGISQKFLRNINQFSSSSRIFHFINSTLSFLQNLLREESSSKFKAIKHRILNFFILVIQMNINSLNSVISNWGRYFKARER